MALRLLQQIRRRSRYGNPGEPSLSGRSTQALRPIRQTSLVANPDGYGSPGRGPVSRAIAGFVPHLQRLLPATERVHSAVLLRDTDRHVGTVARRLLRALGHGAAMVVVDQRRVVLHPPGSFWNRGGAGD